jgi:hypothetical protein
MRQCSACGGCSRPASTCPSCGFEFPPLEPPKVKIVEAVRVDFTTPIAWKRAFFHEQLEKCKRLGHKPGKAAWIFKSRFGYFPPRGWF